MTELDEPTVEHRPSVARRVVQAADVVPLWVRMAIGLAFLVWGAYRLEQHNHAEAEGVHLMSDWLIISIGLAVVGLGSHVGRGLTALAGGFGAFFSAIKGLLPTRKK